MFDPRDKTPSGRDSNTPFEWMINRVREQLQCGWDYNERARLALIARL